MEVLKKDYFFDEKPRQVRLSDMTDEQWSNCLIKYHKQYKEIFGYIPDESTYSCTREKYAEVLIKAIKEKKEISEYNLEVV